MKLSIFQSDKGDCLLLKTTSGHHMLIDGGMRSSYKTHVAPYLGALQKQNKALDLVYVSHIDRDHISGVLQLMDDVVKWRVYDYQFRNGNARNREPKVPRPPEIKGLWHNAFGEQVKENSKAIGHMLAAAGEVLSASDLPHIQEMAVDTRDLATSTAEAIWLSRRIGPKQLKIPLNVQAGGKLIMVRRRQSTIKFGSASIFVCGPFSKDLKELRAEWKVWLQENQKALGKLKDRAKREEEKLKATEVERLFSPLIHQADDFGNRKKVTVPNLASIMLLIEEEGKKILLTGDGHSDELIKGLRRHKKLPSNGSFHIDVLKVPHHGSEFNVRDDFCQMVHATHYVFCGNGAHHNPELETIQRIVKGRLRQPGHFFLWFNSSSTADTNAKNRAQMARVEKASKQLARKNPGRIKIRFLRKNKSHFELKI